MSARDTHAEWAAGHPPWKPGLLSMLASRAEALAEERTRLLDLGDFRGSLECRIRMEEVLAVADLVRGWA